MYHCHTHFYLVGHHCRAFDLIREMLPLEHFTHEFSASDAPEGELAAIADVILADLQNTDVKEVLQALTISRHKDAELILFADKEQIPLLAEHLPDIKDIWMNPMSDEEIQFRFLRWQQTYKVSKDAWQSSNYLDATINNIPNLIWYKDKKGIHEKVNDSFCQTVNKTKQQVEGQGHAYIWDVEEDDPACIESELKVMNEKRTCISEETINTGEGMKQLKTYKSPLYDIDGSVMGTVGVGIDITRERTYEQEIIKKNQSLEKIFNTIDCGVMRHTVDGKHILDANKVALKILGYETVEELTESGFDMIAASVVDKDKEKLNSAIKKLEKEGDAVSVEYRVRHKNGDILHVMGNIKLLIENGEPIFQRFLLDCTTQKLEEKKKEKRQRELIQALGVDYSLVCYFNLDTGKGFQFQSNEGDGHLLAPIFSGEEISLKESMDKYIEQFVYDDDREMLRQATSKEKIAEELSKQKTHYVNYRVCINDEIKYYQIKIVKAGKWKAYHGIVFGLHSVDESIRSEMEKKNLLEDALARANQASKAKSVFLSNMSHDIRTPMNAIIGFTNLAISHIDHKEQVEEYLKKIMTSGNHLLSLINDVLDMSRIESGKTRLDEKPCSIPDIMHELRNIVHADIRSKQLELHMDAVDVIDEEICCDKLRLNQVLLNLLSNAIKYTPAGGTITMQITEKPDAPTGYATYEFIIKDNGIGMSEDFVKHIFEPFEREKTSTISGIQGTGLGMAITKNIIDMMNGTISVKSELDVGSEFTVIFTFRLHAENKGIQEIPQLKNCRALVVDDDFETCDSVSYMLGQFGLRAEWTLSGKEAVLRTHQAVSRGDGYGVYIIDWMIPDMNGVEVARRIRKKMGENVSIIILTAYDWADIETEAKEAGVTGFCSKPLFLSELGNCLNSIVNAENEADNKNTKTSHEIHAGRILLAEDNEMNQEIAVAILGEAGFEIDVAENGQIAVDMLKASEPGYYQLILMDVQMPVMNGYEATKCIRSLEDKELSSIPIIAMTANAFEEDKQEALKVGMNGHIAKPIEIEKLFDMLNKILH